MFDIYELINLKLVYNNLRIYSDILMLLTISILDYTSTNSIFTTVSVYMSTRYLYTPLHVSCIHVYKSTTYTYTITAMNS